MCLLVRTAEVHTTLSSVMFQLMIMSTDKISILGNTSFLEFPINVSCSGGTVASSVTVTGML